MKAINPRTGKADYRFDAASPEVVHAEAARLRAMQPAWEAHEPADRAAVLDKLSARIERDAQTLFEALAVDTGRRAVARIEIEGLVRNLRRWAARGPELFARLPRDPAPSATPGIALVPSFSAYPLFGAIAPWNFPVVLSHIDAVPALMAGCAALVKPSEVTPRFVAPMRAILAEFPQLPLAYVLGGPETGMALVGANERESLESSVAAAKARVERLRERIRAESIQLGKLEDLNARNNALARLAEESRLRLDTIRPGDAVPGVRYTGVPIRLLGTGTYAECVEFLERLRRVFPDVGVNAFDLRSVPGGGATFVFDLVWFTAPTARPSPSAQISSSGAGAGP
ncbi:aldehyde dehydrogenase family protein [Leptolyngbya sp. 15MV]|nr:aldehyde dehydrogenase family protein [Leptolyngbya sp. 15MV]